MYYKHGLRKHPIYALWTNIKQRCLNKKNPQYKNYGGRGITICDEWLNDFQKFYDWAVSNSWEKELQIDRINNDGNYEPGNCRFVDNYTNSQNKTIISNTGQKLIYFEKSRNKFVVQKYIGNRKTSYCGRFNSLEEAIKFRDQIIMSNVKKRDN